MNVIDKIEKQQCKDGKKERRYAAGIAAYQSDGEVTPCSREKDDEIHGEHDPSGSAEFVL